MIADSSHQLAGLAFGEGLALASGEVFRRPVERRGVRSAPGLTSKEATGVPLRFRPPVAVGQPVKVRAREGRGGLRQVDTYGPVAPSGRNTLVSGDRVSQSETTPIARGRLPETTKVCGLAQLTRSGKYRSNIF